MHSHHLSMLPNPSDEIAGKIILVAFNLLLLGADLEKVWSMWIRTKNESRFSPTMEEFHSILGSHSTFSQEAITKLLHWGRNISKNDVPVTDIAANYRVYQRSLEATISDVCIYFYHLLILF